MAQHTARTATRAVADICLYGTAHTGAGYLGVVLPHGQVFGTGDPERGRTFTEAIWLAVGELRARGLVRGLVRVFDAGGERMTVIVDVAQAIPCYGDLRWTAADFYTLDVDALVAATAAAETR